MKKLLLGASALAISAGVNAQTYFSDDFSSGNLNNWTLINTDGDGHEWGVVDYGTGNGEGNVAFSASWDGTDGALNPDNWMITPAIDLTSASGTVNLSWKVYAQDQSWVAENYTVYVATGADVASLTGATTTFNEVLTTSAGYMDRSLDVSAYIGQTIYVGFRHHNVSDQFRMNIDDVLVKTLQPYDIAMTAVTAPSVAEAGNVNITGTVTNEGGNDITSIDVTWNDGSGDNTETIAVNLSSGQTYNFTHGTPLAVAAGQNYNLTVSVTTANDGDATNNSMMHSISGLAFLPERHVVIEEGTGTWCGWCPRGAVALEAMDNDAQRDRFIGIAVHNGDPMTVAAYDAGASFSGYPSMNVNRSFLDEGVSTQNMQTMYDQAIDVPTNSEINISNVTYDATTGNWTADVSVHWASAVSEDHRIAIVVIEDDVTGTASGYNQTNYYNGGTNGALSGGGIADWTTAGDPVPAADMVYAHVGRELVGGDYNGIAGSISTPVAANSYTDYSASGTLNAAWDASKVKLVAMVIKQSNGEIMNAMETTWALASVEENIIENVNVYPNPATDVLNVSFEANNADYTVSLTDLSGRTMVSNTLSSLSGAQSLALPVADLANGNYILTITSEEGSYTQKVVIK